MCEDTVLLFITGRPLSGRTTQVEYLLDTIEGAVDINHSRRFDELISVRECEGQLLGLYLYHNLDTVHLDPITTEYVQDELSKFLRSRRPPPLVCIDGFPYTEEQALALPLMCQGRRTLVLNLHINEGAQRERCEAFNIESLWDDIQFEDSTYTKYHASIEAFFEALGVYKRLDGEVDEETLASQVRGCLSSMPARMPIPPNPSATTKLGELMHKATAMWHARIIQLTVELLNPPKYRKHQFCGGHPITLTRDAMWRLRRYPYHASLKVDGYRYLCVVYMSTLWFVNRRLDVWKGPVLDALKPWNNTILDGEVLSNNLFMVIDVLCVQGANCMEKELMERLRLGVPLGKLMYNGPLFFRPQLYVDSRCIELLKPEGLPHGCKTDGYVFTPSKLPARIGIDYNMYKWKPLEHNTVDAVYRKGLLYCRGDRRKADICIGGVSAEHTPEWVREGMIVECRVSPDCTKEQTETGQLSWIPTRSRSDKLSPNAAWVANSVIKSIQDNITREELLAECTAERTCTNPHNRLFVPSSSSHRWPKESRPMGEDRC